MAKKAKPADIPREGVNTRITRELRDKLDEAAAKSGRSVGSEIERRLENSFLIPEEFYRLLENKATSRVLWLIAQSWEVLEILMEKRWYEDQDTLAAAKSSAAAIVGALQPQTVLPAIPPTELLNIRDIDLELIGKRSSEFITSRLAGTPLSSDFPAEVKGLLARTARKPNEDAPITDAPRHKTRAPRE